METKCIILWKFTKNGQNDQKIDKMTKKAKIRQKCQIFKIFGQFCLYCGHFDFFRRFGQKVKSNLFAICDIIFSPKSLILASKITFLSIFEIWPLNTPKPSLFATQNWRSSFSLAFSFFREPLTDNGVQMHYFMKIYKKWTKLPKNRQND